MFFSVMLFAFKMKELKRLLGLKLWIVIEPGSLRAKMTRDRFLILAF